MRKTIRKKHDLYRVEPAYALPKKFGGKAHYPELISEHELEVERKKLSTRLIVAEEIVLPPIQQSMRAGAKRKSRAAKIIGAIRAWALRIMERLLPRNAKRRLSRQGEVALMRLKELSDLYSATGAPDGMEIVALEAAFGEAYYAILSESRGHHERKKKGHHDASEDYALHLQKFAKQASGIC